jgi:hypothetical protein
MPSRRAAARPIQPAFAVCVDTTSGFRSANAAVTSPSARTSFNGWIGRPK